MTGREQELFATFVRQHLTGEYIFTPVDGFDYTTQEKNLYRIQGATRTLICSVQDALDMPLVKLYKLCTGKR